MTRTKIIKVNPMAPSSERIREAAEIIKKGGLVAFPTETVYGLGAAYNNPDAVKKIYDVKKRPKDKPLTIHISKMEDLEEFDLEIPYLAEVLIDRFWPGPLTMILYTKDRKKTIAFRMPKNEIARHFIDACGIALVAPSANKAGKKGPVNAEQVLEDLDGKIEAVIDGGPTEVGKESTIIDTTWFPYRVVREGAIPKTIIKDVWDSL